MNRNILGITGGHIDLYLLIRVSQVRDLHGPTRCKTFTRKCANLQSVT